MSRYTLLVVIFLTYSTSTFSQQFEWVEKPSEGLSYALKNKKWGFIDEKGNVIIPFQYDLARSFANGLAAVKVGEKWGIIDRNGKFIFEPQFDVVHSPDDCQCNPRIIIVEKGGKAGFIKLDGTLFEPQFEELYLFYCGLAKVKKNGKYGFIDSSGTFVVEPKYKSVHEVHSFSNNRAAVSIKGKIGFINTAGKVAIDAKYDYEPGGFVDTLRSPSAISFSLNDFSENVARVVLNGKHVIIDTMGRVISTTKYGGDPFRCGLSKFTTTTTSGIKYGFLNRNGVVVIPAKYTDARIDISCEIFAAELIDEHKSHWVKLDNHGTIISH